MSLIAVFIGLVWKPLHLVKLRWNFSTPFSLCFFTTFFTNGQGFFTGIVGSLGYWLSQQSVNRGDAALVLLYFPPNSYVRVSGCPGIDPGGGLWVASTACFRRCQEFPPAAQSVETQEPLFEQMTLSEIHQAEPAVQQVSRSRITDKFIRKCSC